MINIAYIYLVENCYNNPNKVYIGKTKSTRFYHHKSTYGKNIKYCIIDQINSLDKKDWKPLESYWIEQFRQWGFDVQNKNKGGGGANILSRKTRKLISKNKYEMIWQFDLKGNFIKEWEGIVKTDAYFSSTNKSSSIWACVNGLQKTAYNFIWVKKKNYNKHNINQIVKNLPDFRIIQFNMRGKRIKEWITPNEASKKLNIGRNNIYNNLNGYSKSSGGFVWKYKE